MSSTSGIEWTDATWNPIAGCSPVSPGCEWCYAAKEAIRLAGHPNEAVQRKYEGTAVMRGAGKRRRAVFTGRVNVADAHTILAPLRWQKPRMVFANSMSDLFHESLTDRQIRGLLSVMASAPQHTFQVLTKRPERAQAILSQTVWRFAMSTIQYQRQERTIGVLLTVHALGPDEELPAALPEWEGRFTVGKLLEGFVAPNIWMGTSVENQATAEERIPHLLATPAEVRFLSCEPLLGPVELGQLRCGERFDAEGAPWYQALRGASYWSDGDFGIGGPNIDWVIAGGESGPGARPPHPFWFESLRDQCQAAGVPFFFKQWGAWELGLPNGAQDCVVLEPDGSRVEEFFADQSSCGARCMRRVGKKAAGRELDGREWNEMPQRGEEVTR